MIAAITSAPAPTPGVSREVVRPRMPCTRDLTVCDLYATIRQVFEIRETPEFSAWLAGLEDQTSKGNIVARMTRLQASGNWGDSEPVGNGITELRIHCGPGYRLYCKRFGRGIVLLLLGGDKKSQTRDIKRAKEIAKRWQA